MDNIAGRDPVSRTHLVASFLVGVLVLAAVLRLWGIDIRSLSHPEAYVPGINLVPGISEPPPRHELAETIWWHFHDEPHPMGWYLAMFAWTEIFGTSHLALRFPGILFALGSVSLVFVIARNIFGTTVGCLAALMLALHGFHIYWSQTARMYVPGAFLALLSTWLLLRLVRAREPRPALEAGYIVSVVAGVFTVELFWPLIMIHVFWAMLVLPQFATGMDRRTGQIGFRKAPRLFQIQSIAFILAAPALTHAVYRARKGAAPDPSPEFLMEYFSFGFLFARDNSPIPALHIGTAWAWLLFGFALLLLVSSLRTSKRETPLNISYQGIPMWIPVVAAAAAAGFMLWLAWIAHRRHEALAVLSVLPLLALSIPVLATAWGAYVPRLRAESLRLPRQSALLLWLIAVLSPLVLFIASYKVSVLAPRAFMIFVPFYLMLCAAGVIHVFRHEPLRRTIMGVVILVFAISIPYAARKPGSPRDYRGLAESMLAEMQAGDLILLRNRHWADTPLFYYINDARFIVSDYEAALQAEPEARVWLVTWPWPTAPVINDERREALNGYARKRTIEKRRASAELFERKASQ